jgi:hypothetical protein
MLPAAPASLPFSDAYFDEVHWCEHALGVGGAGMVVKGAAAAAAATAAAVAATAATAAAATAAAGGAAAALPEACDGGTGSSAGTNAGPGSPPRLGWPELLRVLYATQGSNPRLGLGFGLGLGLGLGMPHRARTLDYHRRLRLRPLADPRQARGSARGQACHNSRQASGLVITPDKLTPDKLV